LIDTHTHLFAEQFDADRTQVIHRALNAGVERMLLPNIDQASLTPMFELCDQFPKNCFPMVGLHPCSVQQTIEEQLIPIKKTLWKYRDRCVAVGEIGIDLYWDASRLVEQKYAFTEQINWAKELNLPIVIHVREAFDEVFSILDKLNDSKLRGVFHCFTGSLQQAQHILAYQNFKLGIGGVVTYKKTDLPQILPHIDLEYILIETDSPYLAPIPHRGKRNESAYIAHVVDKLSEIYALPSQEIQTITTRNAENMFF